MRVLSLGLAMTLATLGASSIASAQPTIRVRAETRIELDARRDDGGIVVRGALRDDAGEPLADRRVSIAVRPAQAPTLTSVSAATDSAGRFAARVDAPLGTYVVEASFEAQSDLLGSSARITLDRVRSHVVLVVDVVGGSRLSLDEASHHFRVTATSATSGTGLPITITNELGSPVASGTTDAAGRLAVEVPSTSLGPPAAGRLVVRSPGDDLRSPAQTEVPIVRFRQTSIEWTDDETEARSGLVLRGRLRTATGPLERRAIGVFVDGEHASTRLTGPRGEFSVTLDPSISTERATLAVVARFDSDAPWLASSESPPRSLAVASSSPGRLRMLVLVSLALVGAFGVWLRRRPVAGAPPPARRTAPGIAQGRTTTLLPQVRGLGGTVVQATSGAPIERASIRCGSSTTVTDAEGLFDLEVADGAHAIVIEADGCEPIEHRVSSPHRGEWRGMVIRLESRRELASRAVLEVLGPWAQRETWSIATDRELLDHARTHGRALREIVELVDEVERLVYGDASPGREDLERVRALAARARTALTARVDSGSTVSL